VFGGMDRNRFMKIRRLLVHTFAILLGSAAMMTSSALAETMRKQPVAVLELFTSQGCSSCPPADKVLASYEDRQDVIALAYHVDYWDYIGWRDTFGDPAYSDYQRAYASAQGKSRIYTPQLMINGVEDVVGSRGSAIEAAVSKAKLQVPVELNSDAGMLSVDIGAQSGLGEAVVWLVTYNQHADVKIERGENRGNTLSYGQIVTGRQVLGMWSAEHGAHIKLPLHEVLDKKSSDGAAIIVQENIDDLPGAILGAASFTY
jgi:hypothetical protein